MVDLSIIILNYRQRGMVRQCLRGILLAEPRCRYEVIVVDNHSGDGCLEMVAELFPWAIRIASPKNCGFGAGNNLGMKRARGSAILIMNPDLTAQPGQIDALCDFFQSHPRAGIVGPRLTNPDGSLQDSCRRFPRLLTPLFRRTWLGRLPFVQPSLDDFLMHDFDHATDCRVDWLMGACLLLRREAVQAAGMFDERYFLYSEDLDLCRRVWAAGWEAWYTASVTLVHYHQRASASFGGLTTLANRAAWQHLRSAVQYYRKYFGEPLPKDSPSGQQTPRGVQ